MWGKNNEIVVNSPPQFTMKDYRVEWGTSAFVIDIASFAMIIKDKNRKVELQ